jgi:serine protease Do
LSPVVRQIIAHGSVSRPRLGVAIRDVPPDDPQRQFVIALGNLPAIRITGVILNSPAARAGLQAGDLILAFGKQSVADPAAFAAAIAAASSGPNQMQILRQDQLISVTVDLEAVLP